ncbi:prepilin peptidase [Candidatus Woesearchaeota archaeon]|nr:prepilin peptidase [Candidatus Woesearchaeota archaeon]
MLDIILYSAAIMALLISSVSDLKIREVPDWVSYSLIFLALASRLIFSLHEHDFIPFLQGLVGFAVMFLIALAMFYTGQWGGGDSKLLMGIGAVFGIPFSLQQIPLLVIFIVNLLFLGTVYGLIWSVALVVIRFRDFRKEFKALFRKRVSVMSLRYVLIFSFCLFILVFFTRIRLLQVMLLALAGIAIITFFVSIAIKAVENSCMYKHLPPEKLTEGDWIAEDIKVSGRHICGPKDLGISKEQIRELIMLKKQKKISRVLVKEGIPFVPSFLFAMIATMMLGNWLALVMR